MNFSSCWLGLPGSWLDRRTGPNRRLAASICAIVLFGLWPFHSWAQDMCVECDALKVQLRIAEDKHESLGEGLRMLEQARREMQSNIDASDRLAAAYLVLQSVNVSIGVATIPCSIPFQWLRALMGASSAVGAFLQDEDATEVTLAAIVSYAGGGVTSEAISAIQFMQTYSDESRGIEAFVQDMDRAISDMQDAQRRLDRERLMLESNLSSGGCDMEPIWLDELR